MAKKRSNYKKIFLEFWGLEPWDWIPCWMEYDGVRCGKTSNDIDHIETGRGVGTDKVENLMPLCRDCHTNKGGRAFKDIQKSIIIRLIKIKNAA